MEQLTLAEILELKNLAESLVDSQVNYWITTTFATIVAGFAARGVLTKGMRLVVVALYLLATFVFMSRAYYESLDIRAYNDLLSALGVEVHFPTAAITGQTVLVGAGALATLYFVLLGSREHAS